MCTSYLCLYMHIGVYQPYAHRTSSSDCLILRISGSLNYLLTNEMAQFCIKVKFVSMFFNMVFVLKLIEAIYIYYMS